MKRPSFEIAKLVPGGNQEPRRSKFDMMPKMGIDGVILKSKKKSLDIDGMK